MYEKYSGLPDTTRPASQSASRNGERNGPSRAYSVDGKREYYQAPGKNGSSSSHRTSLKRAKARRRRLMMGAVSLVLLALLIVAIVVLVRSCSEPAEVDLVTGRFRSGVYINWTDVSDKTVDEVRGLLETNEIDSLNQIAVTLSSTELNATITGADMGATSNLNEVIAQALAGGANRDYYSTISIDEAALSARINDINATSSKPPVDASFTFEFSSSGKPTLQYVDGQTGFGLEVESTVAMIKQAVEARNLQTTLTPTLTTIEPSVTTADVQAQIALVGKFTTTYDYKGTAEDTEEQRTILIPNRAFNVEKAAKKINNKVVAPGAKWSFNDVVGDRTEANGWKEANGIFGGDKFTYQFGGGVCQVSTTLYNALLDAYADMNIVERHRHSIPSTYVDKGLDATVDTNHIDFSFSNATDQPLYIFAYYTDNKMAKSRKRDLTVVIYGKALPEGTEYKTRTVLISTEPPGTPILTDSNKLFIGEEKILAEARSKYVVDVYVDWYINGVLQEEYWQYTDTYEGNPERKQVGTMPTPSPEPTPTPSSEGS
jgi:vancomycin resistance protein YoaR